MRWVLRAIAAMVVLAAGMGQSQGQAQAPAGRLALVIGIGEYGRERAAQEAAGFVVPPPLANAVRDSQLVADALEAKGFAVVRVENPDKRALLSAVNAFAARLNAAGPDAVGVFYFAGHGAQGRPALERDIDNYLIPLGADLATEVDLESEALALSRVSATLRPAARGAMVLILDACRDFALPAASRSGLVTRGLAEARAAPGTIIAYATAPGATALDALPGARNGPYAGALAAEVRAAEGARLEDVFIAVRNTVLDQTRGTQVPWENGSLRRAVTLGVRSASAPSADEQQELQKLREVIARLEKERDSRGGGPRAAGREIRDCDVCPAMVFVGGGILPAGWHQGRSVGQYLIGAYEVTFAEWDACVASGGCGGYRPSDNGWGRGDRPVMNVSWEDAKRYVEWLSQRTRKRYRLPSDDEWENAARSGSPHSYWWGNTITAEQANYDSNNDARTTPVGSFAPNSAGLFDVHGNVWEWMEDCFDTRCTDRSIRGGSWNYIPNHLVFDARGNGTPSHRFDYVGFRVLRQ